MQLKSRVTDIFDERLKGGVFIQVLAAIVGKYRIFFTVEISMNFYF